MRNILIWLFSNNIKKRFQIEVQLMLYFYSKFRFIRKFFQRRIYYTYHCEISPTAKIDPSTQFVHPIGIVIGSKAVIEQNCFIYQHVTLGSNFNSENSMPYIKEGCKIGAGAKLIGGITIGKNCIIGANSVVTKSIPDNSTVVGINQIIKIND